MLLLANIPAEGLRLMLHGGGAPLWHRLVTIGNSTTLNLVCAAVAAAAFGYAIWKLLVPADDRRTGLVPFLAFAAFFVTPPFARQIVSLSPVMLSLAPVALAFAMLALPVGGVGGVVKFLVSGAFAAIAAWESTSGVVFAGILLLATWLPRVCRSHKPTMASTLWLVGFVLSFAVEGICLKFALGNLRPSLPPVGGLTLFLFVGALPTLAFYRVEPVRWTFIGWGGGLLVLLLVTLVGGHYRPSSGCETFTRAVLADLGERKLIIGDVITDDFFSALKPADVRFLRVRNDADREFMLNAFEGKEPVTNKALVVRLYRKIPEWSGVEKELKLKGDSPLANLEARRAEALKRREAEKNPVPIAVVMSNEVSRISKSAKPLMEIIRAAEAEFAKPAGKRNRAKMEKARETIRRAWLAHAFGGTRLSSVLLMSDLMLGDRRSAVSDALTVLLTDREDPSANAALGAIRQEEGKFELAERYLRKGVKGGGAFPMGKLAILLIQTDRAAEAVEWARKAVKVSPNDPSLREPLVAALIETGKLDEAEAELKELEKIARQGGGDQKKELKFAAEARKRIGGKRPGK